VRTQSLTVAYVKTSIASRQGVQRKVRGGPSLFFYNASLPVSAMKVSEKVGQADATNWSRAIDVEELWWYSLGERSSQLQVLKSIVLIEFNDTVKYELDSQ
jgi:hypothetical protein